MNRQLYLDCEIKQESKNIMKSKFVIRNLQNNGYLYEIVDYNKRYYWTLDIDEADKFNSLKESVTFCEENKEYFIKSKIYFKIEEIFYIDE
mgnify:CR=1 FL=1